MFMRRHLSHCTLLGLAGAAALLAGCASGPDQSEPEAAPAAAAEPSLYDRLGGLGSISVVVSDFLDEMVPDPFLNQNPAIAEARSRVPAELLKYQVTAMVCQATGGPCEYTGPSMRDAHAHLNITSAEWDRMVEIFVGVLDKHSVPQAEQQELLAIIGTTKDDIVTAG